MESHLQEKMQKMVQSSPVIIYGAHLVAMELYRYLQTLYPGMCFLGFGVTEVSDNPAMIEKEKVLEITAYRAVKNAAVMIAMPEKYHAEAENYARELGFEQILRVGLEEMTALKKKQLLLLYRKKIGCRFRLYEDVYDASWLNMADIRRDIRSGDADITYGADERHYKFPVLYYLNLDETLQEAERFDFYQAYERAFGTYRNLNSFVIRKGRTGQEQKERVKQENRKAEEVLHVYMVFSQWDSAQLPQKELSPWIRPLQAGSILAARKIGPFMDETGVNISEKNSVFAEMTAAYWIWKNAEPVRYKGLCHYRRHFVLTEKQILALEENHVDVLLTTPRYAPRGIGRMFLDETPVKEPVYQNMLQAVAECHPEERDALESHMEQCLYCPNNMVIARSGIYDKYCEWIFPVLFRMWEADAENGYGHRKDRHIAYAAELLTSYFFSKHKDEYFMAVTDYKFFS